MLILSFIIGIIIYLIFNQLNTFDIGGQSEDEWDEDPFSDDWDDGTGANSGMWWTVRDADDSDGECPAPASVPAPAAPAAEEGVPPEPPPASSEDEDEDDDEDDEEEDWPGYFSIVTMIRTTEWTREPDGPFRTGDDRFPARDWNIRARWGLVPITENELANWSGNSLIPNTLAGGPNPDCVNEPLPATNPFPPGHEPQSTWSDGAHDPIGRRWRWWAPPETTWVKGRPQHGRGIIPAPFKLTRDQYQELEDLMREYSENPDFNPLELASK